MIPEFLKTSVQPGFAGLILGIIFLSLPMQTDAQVDTRIDTAHITIGEPIRYTLSVSLKNKPKVILPPVSDTLSSHVEVLSHKTDTLTEADDPKLVRELILTAYDPGDYLIRSLPVVINQDTLLSHSFQIRVDPVKIDSANLGGFPIKPIMDESYTWKDYLRKYLVEGLIILLMLLVLASVWWWMKNRERKKVEKQKLKSPYEEAIDALKELDNRKYISKGQVKPYYSDLSHLLRRYLGRVFNFSSMELLSDDLVEHFRNSDQLSAADTDRLKEFLFDSDLVKYAKAVPEADRHELYRKWAEALIERTKPAETEEGPAENNKKVLK